MRQGREIRTVYRCATALVVATCVWAWAATSAQAAPPLLWQNCATGGAAAQCQIPRGIAVNPASGHLYVADQINARIDEFDVWGQFIKAWGWGVRDGASELQTCTVLTSCRAGLKGGGAGEFESVKGVALDSTGDVYVVDLPAHRVQKFDPEGHFLLTFGGGVNKTKVETIGSTEAERNLCTAASTDVCQAGSVGTGAAEFGTWVVGSFLAVGPGDTVYVGDSGRVQRFDSGGNYLGDLPDPDGLLVGQTVQSLAVAPLGAPNAGNLYLSFGEGFEESKKDVVELSPAGKALCTAKVGSPSALASDGIGHLYVVDGSEVREFGPDCAPLGTFAAGLSTEPSHGTGLATSSACGITGVNVYAANSNEKLSFIRAFGPPPNPHICPPPSVPPDVASQYATSVLSTSATLGAQINPHFWPDATYYLEYGTGKCGEGGCPGKALFPGAPLGGGTVDGLLATKGALVSGLSPATTYHYRFVVKSGGGGPVPGAEHAFTTFPPPPRLREPDPCPNAAFRSGPSANLTDCRAYEMVSPVDKESGDIAVLHGFSLARLARLDQAAEDGERVTYSSYRAFGGPSGAPYTSQYMASRQPGLGWSTEPISPPSEGSSIYKNAEFAGNDTIGLDTHYKAFSEDLCDGWVLQDTEPALTAGALVGFPNLYQRKSCGAVGLEALSTVKPQVKPPEFVPAIEGFSTDGSRTFFTAKGKLTPNASGKRQLYERYAGNLSLVCVLPSGAAYAGQCTLGSPDGTEGGNRDASVLGGVSADGSRVFWSDAEGKIYLREHPEQPQSKVSGGKCIEAGKACTVAISGGPAFFWTARSDGSAALFSTPGVLDQEGLFMAEVDDKNVVTTTEITHEMRGVTGTSADLARVYLVSKDVLSPKANGEGAMAQAGKPNLYLYEAGGEAFTFIATLSNLDDEPLSTGQPSPIAHRPENRSARVSPDGRYLAFMSTAPLTGYDNTDQRSGEADAEVFRYDAATRKLFCVSCNPTGARPLGVQIKKEGEGGNLWAAGQIPGWEGQLHPSRVLSANGDRLFFESLDPLVLRDTNSAWDVYEWEPGSSQGACESDYGAELFVPSSGGCLSLISSGESPSNSSFVDASARGRDVFFTTASSLVVQDPGLVDVYDAREGGGFTPPPGPRPECEGQACQNPPSPPSEVTPSSLSFHGKGNPKPKRHKKKSRKHKKKHHQHHGKRQAR